METIKSLVSLAVDIYNLSEEVKSNKERSKRVARMVKAAMCCTDKINQKNIKDIEEPLEALHTTLISAKDLLKKFASINLLMRILKVNRYKDDFNDVMDHLDDARKDLCMHLQIEAADNKSKLDDFMERVEDGQKDTKDLMKYVEEELKRKQAEITELLEAKNNLQKEVDSFKDPADNVLKDIKKIEPEELTFLGKIDTGEVESSSQVYKAEYGGFTVAVKRFINPEETNLSKLQSDFCREAANLRRFVSPNVLRLYGICIKDELGASPEFLIIMEYCEKGTLRAFLKKFPNLPWPLKGRMCLDAAQGLNRLHRQELKEKSKVVTYINSSSFLVDQDNRVKLGGLELAKTLSSLQISNTKTKTKKKSSMCYICPEKINEPSRKYSKEWEMYSFGIIMWEIATGKEPFEGCEGPQIYDRVRNQDKFQEPLPDDCPPPLAELINACRAYDPFQRPTSGVLVDKLRSVVGKMEAQ